MALAGEQGEVARAARWREVEERLKKDRSPSSDGVGDDSPRSPWDTSNNTLLAHESLYPGTGPSLDLRPTLSLSLFSRASFPSSRAPTFRAFMRRSVDAREDVPTSSSRPCFRRPLSSPNDGRDHHEIPRNRRPYVTVFDAFMRQTRISRSCS